MGLWQVFYANWQMECCGTRFSVGDEVTWPLLFTDPDDLLGGGWSAELSDVGGTVERVRDECDGVVSFVRVDGGPVVALHGDPVSDTALEPARPFRKTGFLAVETHSGEWPTTTGHVRTVRLVTQAYAETTPGSRSWEPVPGERSLQLVDSCPKWFGEDDVDTSSRTGSGAGRRRVRAGVLVGLEVAPEAGGPGRSRGRQA